MNGPQAEQLPFLNLQCVQRTAAVEVLTGTDYSHQPVTVVILTPAAAAEERFRKAFRIAVNRAREHLALNEVDIHQADMDAPRPWAASYRRPEQTGAERLVTVMGILPPPTPSVTSGAPAMFADAQSSGRWGTPTPASDRAVAGYAPVSPARGVSTPVSAPVSGAAASASGSWTSTPVPPPLAPSGGDHQRSIVMILSVTAVVLAFLVTVSIVVALNRRSESSADPTPAPTTSTPSPSVENTTAPTASPTEEPPPSQETTRLGEGRPELIEDAEPVVLVGPTFTVDEPTYTMAFRGWPFAFRTPASWGCARQPYNAMPRVESWVCKDEETHIADQFLLVILRNCPNGCDQQEQQEMNEEWLSQPESARQFDEVTAYVEIHINDLYYIDLGRFFAEEPGGPLLWQVGVFVSSPQGSRETVQKIVNDILTQTPYH